MTGLSRPAAPFGQILTVIVLGFVCPAAISAGQSPAVASKRDDAKQIASVRFSGEVVDLDGDRPIEGAEVVVERSVLIPLGRRSRPGQARPAPHRRRGPIQHHVPARAGGRAAAPDRAAGESSRLRVAEGPPVPPRYAVARAAVW